MHKRVLLLLLAPAISSHRPELSLTPHHHAGAGIAVSGKPAVTPRVERLDPALDALIPLNAEMTVIASGFGWTEGPLWLPSDRLIFAEIPSNSIRLWTPGVGVSIFMQPSGYVGAQPFGGPEPGSNGMTLDQQGRLTIAGHARRNVWRLERLSSNAQVTLLADMYQGKRLNSPNDLVFKSDGSLYFTDPTFGLPTQAPGDPAQELKFQGVYRISGAARQRPGAAPARAALEVLVTDLPEPNGLAFSPDEKYLYVDNSLPEMLWMRYSVRPDGSLTDRTVLFDAGPYAKHGAPDGMKVDQRGNIYSAGPGGVWIFSPAGKHLGTIRFEEPVGNLAWGGQDFGTLYITASSTVYSISVTVPGVSPRLLPRP